MLSNPQSPKPSRWILEMFASDIPDWYRAFYELERKPLNALDEMLVHSFDRYLHRKGYLTKRQVEVLQGIARKHNVLLPPIPPILHHSESTQTTEDPIALLREVRIPRTSSNLMEEQEAEAIKPQVLERWRGYVPEETITALIKQHVEVATARKYEREIRIPELGYSVPLLPKVEEKAEVVAMAIDTDGWLEERKTGGDKIRKIDRWLYRWEYTVPAIGFETETYKLTEHIANMLNTAVTPVRTTYREKVTTMYRTIAWTSRAMRAIQLCEPHFLKWKERARQYLEKYKSKPSHPIPT